MGKSIPRRFGNARRYLRKKRLKTNVRATLNIRLKIMDGSSKIILKVYPNNAIVAL